MNISVLQVENGVSNRTPADTTFDDVVVPLSLFHAAMEMSRNRRYVSYPGHKAPNELWVIDTPLDEPYVWEARKKRAHDLLVAPFKACNVSSGYGGGIIDGAEKRLAAFLKEKGSVKFNRFSSQEDVQKECHDVAWNLAQEYYSASGFGKLYGGVLRDFLLPLKQARKVVSDTVAEFVKQVADPSRKSEKDTAATSASRWEEYDAMQAKAKADADAAAEAARVKQDAAAKAAMEKQEARASAEAAAAKAALEKRETDAREAAEAAEKVAKEKEEAAAKAAKTKKKVAAAVAAAAKYTGFKEGLTAAIMEHPSGKRKALQRYCDFLQQKQQHDAKGPYSNILTRLNGENDVVRLKYMKKLLGVASKQSAPALELADHEAVTLRRVKRDMALVKNAIKEQKERASSASSSAPAAAFPAWDKLVAFVSDGAEEDEASEGEENEEVSKPEYDKEGGIFMTAVCAPSEGKNVMGALQELHKTLKSYTEPSRKQMMAALVATAYNKYLLDDDAACEAVAAVENYICVYERCIPLYDVVNRDYEVDDNVMADLETLATALGCTFDVDGVAVPPAVLGGTSSSSSSSNTTSSGSSSSGSSISQKLRVKDRKTCPDLEVVLRNEYDIDKENTRIHATSEELVASYKTGGGECDSDWHIQKALKKLLGGGTSLKKVWVYRGIKRKQTEEAVGSKRKREEEEEDSSGENKE